MGDTPSPRRLLVTGFFYPYRGLRFLLGHPRLLPYVAIPIAINTLLYTGLVWFAGSRFGDWMERLVPQGEAWYWAVLTAVLWLLFAVLLLLTLVYTFTLVGNLLLAPFNDYLSEKVEWLYAGNHLDEPFRVGALLRDVWRSLRAELGRLALYLGCLGVLLPLHLFPPVGTAVYGAAFTAVTLFFLGWEYLDFSMERWHLGFGAKRTLAFGNLGALLSFGAGAILLLLIPLINLLAIPVCVIGGTLLICDLRAAGRTPAPPPREAGARPGG
jgi:CysZ protein